jgi:hypothetical protein
MTRGQLVCDVEIRPETKEQLPRRIHAGKEGRPRRGCSQRGVGEIKQAAERR